jgi:exodeoxyribonuclease VII large subunit
VGHETDVSIADFVSDVRAPTPSAAAELLSPDQQIIKQLLVSQHQKLVRLILRELEQRHQRLDWLRRQLQHPGRRLQEQAQTLDQLDERLRRAMQRFVQLKRNNLQMLARNLENISPLQTLQRGYSITRTEQGNVITKAASVRLGDTLVSTLADGELVSVICAVKEN